MPEPTDGRAGRRFKLSPRMTIGIVVGVLALLLLFQNTRRTGVHLLFWHVDRPEWLWLLIFFAAGFVVGSIYPWFRRRRKAVPAQTPTPPAAAD